MTKAQKKPVEVGSSVRYSQAFLRNTATYTGNIPFAKGKVTNLLHLSKETTLAEVEWDLPDVPATVNVGNLEVLK